LYSVGSTEVLYLYSQPYTRHRTVNVWPSDVAGVFGLLLSNTENVNWATHSVIYTLYSYIRLLICTR